MRNVLCVYFVDRSVEEVLVACCLFSPFNNKQILFQNVLYVTFSARQKITMESQKKQHWGK